MSLLLFMLVVVCQHILPVDACIAADSLQFAIIQPGQPGAPQDAQPVMDKLAAYLQTKFGARAKVTGSYFNAPAEALNSLRTQPPAWGIISRGFYAAHGAEFAMLPIASTRPGGFNKDVLRLVVGRDAPDSWESLRGTVAGTMLFDATATACELFGRPLQQLPFGLVGTFQPLKSVREVSMGKTAGVVLDRLQYQSLQSMSIAESIKIIMTSRELPTSPVVWFGPKTPLTEELAAVLMAMPQDPDAALLLKTLQTDGFGPVDDDLQKIQKGRTDDVSCP